MVYLTNRFLHLFLVVIAIGIFDLSSSSTPDNAVYAAPLTASAGRRNSQDAITAIASRNARIASRSASSSFTDFEITEEGKSTQTLPLTKIDQRSQRGHPLMVSMPSNVALTMIFLLIHLYFSYCNTTSTRRMSNWPR